MSKTKSLNDLLDRLQIDDETRRKTGELFREAIHLTRPGSDHPLTLGQHGLPAACLFIASSRLGITDITKQVAQSAACIDPRTFDKVLATVERALSSKPSSPVKPKANDITSFHLLVKQYHGREDACVVMAEVEAKLLQDKVVENTKTAVYQGAIFSWVYFNVFEMSFPGEDIIKKQVNASIREWSSARRILDKCCSELKETLKSHAETAALSRPRTRRSQSFRTLVSSIHPVTPPTKKSPERIPLTPSLSTPTRLSKVETMKRKRPSNILMEEIITSPSKRPKTTMELLYPNTSTTTGDDNFNLTTTTTTPTKLSNSVTKTTTTTTQTTEKLTTLILDDRESKSNLSLSSTKTTTPTTVSRAASLFDTSTGGTSDLFSPLSSSSTNSPTEKKLRLSLQPTRRRVKSFSSLISSNNNNQKQIPILNHGGGEEEDISTTRRKRRNLRAAFLDPDIYGWKPSLVVSRRLKLAEVWEKELINNFGDPWDDNWLRKNRGAGGEERRQPVE